MLKSPILSKSIWYYRAQEKTFRILRYFLYPPNPLLTSCHIHLLYLAWQSVDFSHLGPTLPSFHDPSTTMSPALIPPSSSNLQACKSGWSITKFPRNTREHSLYLKHSTKALENNYLTTKVAYISVFPLSFELLEAQRSATSFYLSPKQRAFVQL